MTCRQKIFAAFSLAVIAIAAVIAFASFRPPLPIDHAVLDTDPRDRVDYRYQWAPGQDGLTLGLRWVGSRIDAVSVDPKTNGLTPLPNLVKTLMRLQPTLGSGKGRHLGPSDGLVLMPSPDSRWILMTYQEDYTFDIPHTLFIYRHVYIVRADGKQVLSVAKDNPDAQVFWQSDSLHWVEYTPAAYVVHDFAAPKVSLRLPNTLAATPGVPAKAFFLMDVAPLPAGGWITADWSMEMDRRSAVVWRASVESHAVVVRPVIVATVPGGTDADGAVLLSPGGDHVAWMIDRALPHAPPAVSGLLRFCPPPTQKLLHPILYPGEQSLVWSSRADGSDVRQISVSARKGGRLSALPFGWSHDGRRLLFWGKPPGTLYAVPVP